MIERAAHAASPPTSDPPPAAACRGPAFLRRVSEAGGGRWTPPGPSCHSPCSGAAIEQDVIVRGSQVFERARALRAV